MHNFSNKLNYLQLRGKAICLALMPNELSETDAIILRRNDSLSILICSLSNNADFSSIVKNESTT